MKILLINGSPKGRRSNSLRVAQAFCEGFCESTGAEVDTVTLSEMDIKGCKGCFGCWKGTPGKCVIKDDMPVIIEKLIAADVVIYSFPLYYFSVPGILKDMIDRQLPMMLPFMTDREDGLGSGAHPQRYDMAPKRYMLISTCGFYSAEGNYNAVCGMFDHICGKDYDTIFCGQGELFSVDALRSLTDAYLGKVRNAGREFAHGSITAETKASLAELLMPKDVFEKLADESWGVEDSREGTDKPAKKDISLVFTRQMALLYNKDSFDGRERVLEMRYTDIGKAYQIRMGAEGAEVTEDGSAKPDTVINTPFTVWKDIADGRISGTDAMAQHLYTVNGDFDIMINWDKYFGTGGQTAVAKTDRKPAVMTTMLIPWTVFWTVISFGAPWTAIPALAAALMPLIMRKHEQTVYDGISCAAVTILSCISLITGNVAVPACLGYLVFGLMWLLSCFTAEPVSAAYVKYSYGGDSALSNVIFMKTNYILAAAWGILYLAIAAAALITFRYDMFIVRNVITIAAPAAMGAFTVFFERWYPRHVAGAKY
ncbi:MAG: NAD(P)H-dependent oxidoreductase [Oscillospiraceae bacterium]|nr:NAD(P)H-dependent oxidoreductase [Oscillospiraceae bacterium]